VSRRKDAPSRRPPHPCSLPRTRQHRVSSVIRNVRPNACRPGGVLSPCLPGFLCGTAALAAQLFGLEPRPLECPLLSSCFVLDFALSSCNDRWGPDRPHVRQVVGDVRKQRPVVLLILAYERGLVATVQRLIIEPRGQRIRCGKLWLRTDSVDAGCAQVRCNREGTSVAEAELDPSSAAGEPVSAKRFLESSPHEHSRVVGPSVAGPGQCAYHLDRLHTLLAEPLAVQNARRALEVGVGQERLHSPSLPCVSDSAAPGVPTSGTLARATRTLATTLGL
jgi:hypothetical protein